LGVPPKNQKRHHPTGDGVFGFLLSGFHSRFFKKAEKAFLKKNFVTIPHAELLAKEN
jgi:hypothetical protein